MSDDLASYCRNLMKFMDENAIESITYPAETIRMKMKPGEMPEVISVERSKEPPKYKLRPEKLN